MLRGERSHLPVRTVLEQGLRVTRNCWPAMRRSDAVFLIVGLARDSRAFEGTKEKGQTSLSVPPEYSSARGAILPGYRKTRAGILCRAHGPALLEALTAEHGTPLGRPEGNGGFLAALRTVRFGFGTHLRIAAAAPTALGALCFAALAPFRFVLKSLVSEKHLLAGREYKLRVTFRTLQDPVVIFHEPLSPRPVPGRGLGTLRTEEPDCVGKPVSGEAGRGSHGPAGTKLGEKPKRLCLTGA